MAGSDKSSKSYIITTKSLKRDNTAGLAGTLHETRTRKHLSQQDVAAKLGLHQRQISDLERAKVDPRLSTIQNVARALDLELMLIPRHLIGAVEALLRAGSDSADRPMYSLDDEEVEPGSRTPPQ